MTKREEVFPIVNWGSCCFFLTKQIQYIGYSLWWKWEREGECKCECESEFEYGDDFGGRAPVGGLDQPRILARGRARAAFALPS